MSLREFLISNADKKYKEYCKKSIFTKYKIIGVRTKNLKKYAKVILEKQKINDYLKNKDFKTFDEMQLYIYVLNDISDYKLMLEHLDELLDVIDNWCSCDSLRPRAFIDNMDDLRVKIDEWIKTGKTYKIRFAIMCLIRYFSCELQALEKVVNIVNNDYYVNMARAWYFTEALGLEFEQTFEFLKQHKIDKETLNLTYEKIGYSARISKENRTKLKELRKV